MFVVVPECRSASPAVTRERGTNARGTVTQSTAHRTARSDGKSCGTESSCKQGGEIYKVILNFGIRHSCARLQGQLALHLTANQGVASSILGQATYFPWRLVMKYFLQLFYPSADLGRAVVRYWQMHVHLVLVTA